MKVALFKDKKIPNWALREKLRVALLGAWTDETAYPRDASRWSPECPSIGQCAVTSLVIQDYIGGTIKFSGKYNHYWVSLPGEEIDWTKDQFGELISTYDAIEVPREDIISKDRSGNARTYERYKLLSSKVEQEFETLSPMIFLFSSNSRKEYIVDILECLSLPHHFSRHFRYQHQWIANKELLSLLPEEGGKQSSFLMNSIVVPVYLSQTHEAKGKYTWVDAIPIRLARLKKAFRTGDIEDKEAISHFHFELGDYLEQKPGFFGELRRILGKQFGSSYAAFAWGKKDRLFTEHKKNVPFERLAEKLSSDKLTYRSYKDSTEYNSPIFVQIHGLFTSRGRRIDPQDDEVGQNTYYKLAEDKQYYIKFRTYVRGYGSLFRITLAAPKEQFANPEEYELATDSPYDSEAWELIPRYCTQRTRSSLLFQATNENADKQKQDLGLKMRIPIVIGRGWFIRLVDIISDVAFGIIPAYLTLSKLYEKNKPAFLPEWYLVVLPALVIWLATKLIVKFKRG